jgi:hypothetical protein
MIEFGSIHCGKGRNRARQGVSRAGVAENFQHVDLQVKPMRGPIFGEVSLAAGSNLNSGNPLSSVLLPGVEGATRMLSVVELPITGLDNLGNNHKFVEPGKGVDIEVAAEGLHDPNKF